MPNAKPAPQHISVTMAAEEKWKQQVRLACVQAVTARAVASQVMWNTADCIRMAKELTDFVLQSD